MFDLQDEMVAETAGQIIPNLTAAEGEKRGRREVSDLGAWDLLLRARWRSHAYTEEAITAAIALAEQALDLDQSLSEAHIDLGAWWTRVLYNGWRISGRRAMDEIQRHAAAAVRSRPNDPSALAIATGAANFRVDIEEAIRLGRRAATLGPHDAGARMIYGHALVFDGRPARRSSNRPSLGGWPRMRRGASISRSVWPRPTICRASTTAPWPGQTGD